MSSVAVVKMMILIEWQEKLPNRFDREKALKYDHVDERGCIINYENSYSMWHKAMEATREEERELDRMFELAERG